MIKPNYLRKGDKIGIVATGRKVLPGDVEPAKSYFESLGLDVTLAPHLFSDDHPYLASTDQHRLDDLQNMLDDDEIKAIICARGGYGTTRIIDRLRLDQLKRYPKWIVGFSDITALHLQLLRSGIESIHATMPILFSHPESSQSVDSLVGLLFGGKTSIAGKVSPHDRHGKSVGQVIGGNLSLIADSFATASQPDFAEKILVVEETDEHLYKIDRMFTQLRRVGVFEKLNGLIVGHMTNITDTSPKFGEHIEEIIMNHVDSFNFPVAFNFPIGHEHPNFAWVHGSTMTLAVSENESWMRA